MKRTGQWENERLAKVVENFQIHSKATGSHNHETARMAAKMCDIDIWEMWALTQK